ncbi:MAG: GntR family transcriptional regulator [Longimicrobiales bacterium]
METPELVERLRARIRSGDSEPVAQLIVDDLWLSVVDGSLDVGQRLPTVRQLAIGLGVSPRSVERAYRELEQRGVVVTRPGAGSFISLTQPSDEERTRHQELAKLCREIGDRAGELGFTLDELIDALMDFREGQDETRTQEPRR